MKVLFIFLAAVSVLFVCTSCDTITTLGVMGGVIDADQAKSINKAGEAVSKTFEDITPEQEYYIGRSVGANILARYKPYNNKKANNYINLLGQSLALFSDRPETYGGYHFLILDSGEINAFACPGGDIFITRGLLRIAESEDMVASILAHEIGHVQKKHGLQSIKQARVTQALTLSALAATKVAGSQELSDLTAEFEGSLDDIIKTLVVNGYSKEFEKEADTTSAVILKRVGYDAYALIQALKLMEKQLKPGEPDFAKTHPDPEERIKSVKGTVGKTKPDTAVNAERQKRFAAFMALL
jgi:predicted Zn-dependent protease